MICPKTGSHSDALAVTLRPRGRGAAAGAGSVGRVFIAGALTSVRQSEESTERN